MNNNNNNNLNPYFVSGFSDAESCFHVSIVEKAELKVGKSVRVFFQISLHKKDKALLDQIKQFFCRYSDQGDVGKVIDRKVKELIFILDHFDKYPLLSQKRVDFELFKQVINLILRQEHLTGLQEIVNIKASMNFGVLSDNLMTKFPNTVAVSRPIIKDPVIYDPEWVTGFVEGESCFFVNIYKRKDSVLGEGVKLVFKITQDKRNSDLLKRFVEIFGCGGIYNQSKSSSGNVIDFMVTGLSNILDNVIPFFLAHPLQGAKKKELADFIKDGLEQIRAWISNVNNI